MRTFFVQYAVRRHVTEGLVLVEAFQCSYEVTAHSQDDAELVAEWMLQRYFGVHGRVLAVRCYDDVAA